MDEVKAASAAVCDAEVAEADTRLGARAAALAGGVAPTAAAAVAAAAAHRANAAQHAEQSLSNAKAAGRAAVAASRDIKVTRGSGRRATEGAGAHQMGAWERATESGCYRSLLKGQPCVPHGKPKTIENAERVTDGRNVNLVRREVRPLLSRRAPAEPPLFVPAC